MRTGITRLAAVVLVFTITLMGCNRIGNRQDVEALAACGPCPSPQDIYTDDGEHPGALVDSYYEIDAQTCVYALADGEYLQPVSCTPIADDTDDLGAFIAEFQCQDCGCANGVCPTNTDTTVELEQTLVNYNLVVDFFKLVGALTKVAGVAKLVCVVKAALKAAKTAATAISKARGHVTQLKALLATYPNAAQRTPAIVAQIQGEAWRASANYARSLAAARLSLKKSAEAIGIITAGWAGGTYLLGSKDADEKAKKEIEDGMKDAEETLKKAHGENLNDPLPDDVKATQRGRFNRAIEETQRMIDELDTIAKTRALCDDEKELKAVLEQQKEALVKERDMLGGVKK